MTSAEIDEILSGYYRGGAPEAAVEALRHLSRQPELEGRPPDSLVSAASFFAAVGRRSPEVLPAYRALRDSATPAGRRLIEGVLRLAEWPEEPRPIAAAADLDRRWGAFLATGEAAPVREIIAVLSWEDRLRAALEGWLRRRRALDLVLGRARRRAGLARRLGPLGIDVDAEAGRVRTAVDLDCAAIMRGGAVAPDKVRPLQQALPFPLGAAELGYMSTKATALWSLSANAARHPLVLAACAEALAAVPADATQARLSLLAVLAEAHLGAGAPDAALAAAEQALAIDPSDPEALQRRERARRRGAIERARRLFDECEPAGAATEAAVTGLRQRGAAARPGRYRVHAELRGAGRPGNPHREGLAAEWDVLVDGDRFRGERWFWDAESGEALADRWVTLGADHYENPGLWVRWPDPVRDAEHGALRLEAYEELLRRPPDVAERCERGGAGFLILFYGAVRLPRLQPLLGSEDATCEVRLWLGEGDAALAGAVVRARCRSAVGEIEEELRQVFLPAQEEPEILAPAESVDASTAGTRSA